MKVTNTSPGPRGINTTSGPMLLDLGETRDGIDMSRAEFNVSKATGWFAFDGKEPEEKRSQSADAGASSDARKAAAKALLDQSDKMHHAALASQARTILGRDDLSTKDEVVKALEAAAA